MQKGSLDGKNLWDKFDAHLAPYAQNNASSQGRKYPEPADPERLPFQRDRDRIIHSKSFRRLRGKMQVVAPNLGDHFRNRLSHTIEVAQIARDLARQLKLNEDLTEAISLAHDLGHPPFGHSGERTLNEKMIEYEERFDHNKQSLRVVTVFEQRYPDFGGLNLTHEVLQGVQKHERDFSNSSNSEKTYFPHLEAQLVDISDTIAYLSADLEDGLRGGFFTLDDLTTISITAEATDSLKPHEKKDRSSLIRRVIRDLLLQLVKDTRKNLKIHDIKTLQDVQSCPHHIVAFGNNFYQEFQALKQFLFKKYYEAPSVETETKKGQAKITQVFDHLIAHPEDIPVNFLPQEKTPRRVCDYIAGMTDKFLLKFEVL
jgi:dGTPase